MKDLITIKLVEGNEYEIVMEDDFDELYPYEEQREELLDVLLNVLERYRDPEIDKRESLTMQIDVRTRHEPERLFYLNTHYYDFGPFAADLPYEDERIIVKFRDEMIDRVYDAVCDYYTQVSDFFV